MKKKVVLFVLLAALALCALGLFAACAEKQDAPPELTLASDAVSGKVREAIALPSATATDKEDGDLSGQVRIRILFEEDEVYVFPATNPTVGALLGENPTYTPSKVGTYTVTYFVSDSANHSVSATATLTVAENLTDTLGQNLVGAGKEENWIAGGDTQNSVYNDFGEIVVAGKKNTNFTGAVYKGEKLENGDLVSFTFTAQPLSGVMFYNVAFYLTPNSAEDAPAAEEGDWPKFLNMRIGASVQTFAVTINNNNFDLFPQINLNLCDGKEHTVSIRIQAAEDTVSAQLWIDRDTALSPGYTAEIAKETVAARYGEESEALGIFDADIAGWLSFGAYVIGDPSADSFVLRALSLNGGSAVRMPSLSVGQFEPMMLNEEYTLPAAAARDENDYSDVTDRIKVYIKAPDEAEFSLLEEDTVLPDRVGAWQFRYVVTDRNGNTQYAEFSVDCARGESAEPPAIVFADGTQDEYEVSVNTPFTLPVPQSVTDSFGEDLSFRLKVSLTGMEKADLSGEQTYTFRAVGENTVLYSVTDFNGNTTQKEFTVNVTGLAEGNIGERAEDWYVSSGASLSDGAFRITGDGATLAFGGHKVYGEKVSLLMDAKLGSSDTVFFLINIRGGKNLDTVPRTANAPEGSDQFGWNDGISLLIHQEYGFEVKSEGYNGSAYAKATLPGTTAEVFAQRTEFSFRFTDRYAADGTLESILFEAWIGGEKISFTGAWANEDGDVSFSPRVIGINEDLTQAGWLTFYFNGAGTAANIYSLTLDGSKPVTTEITIDKEDDQTFTVGEEYVLPVVTVKRGEEDLSSQVKKFIWINGEEKPDIAGEGYAGASVQTDLRYASGFTVLYVLDGEIIKQVPVSTDSQIAFAWEGEPVLTAALNTAFSVPAYSVTMGEVDLTQDITVRYAYGFKEAELAEGSFTPVTAAAHTLYFYYYDRLVHTEAIAVTGGVGEEENISAQFVTTGGGAYVYRGEQVYNSEVSITFSLDAFESADLLQFGLRGNERPADGWLSFPKGLLLGLKYDPSWGVYFMIGTENNNNWFTVKYAESARKYTETDWTQEHTLVYSVKDVFGDDGTFLGISVRVSLDGEAVAFTNSGGAQIEADGSVLILAETVESYEGAQTEEQRMYSVPSWLFVWGDNIEVALKEVLLKTV